MANIQSTIAGSPPWYSALQQIMFHSEEMKNPDIKFGLKFHFFREILMSLYIIVIRLIGWK